MIEAYRILKNPLFKLVIAGDADHETNYSKRLKKLAYGTEGVVLTGYISGKKLAELYSNAGFFVLPSYYEGLPIALLEALSYGLPVLVSDIPQHREINLSEFIYFEKGNVKALSEALLKTFSLGLIKSERESYISFLQSNYDWDVIASKTFEVYEKVLS